MGVGGIGAAGHDGGKGQLLGPAAAQGELQGKRDLAFRLAGAQALEGLEEGGLCHRLGGAYGRHLGRLLHLAQGQDIAAALQQARLGQLLAVGAVELERRGVVDGNGGAGQAGLPQHARGKGSRAGGLGVDAPQALCLRSRGHGSGIAAVRVDHSAMRGDQRRVGLLGIEDPLEAREPLEVGGGAAQEGVDALLCHEGAQALQARGGPHRRPPWPRCSSSRSKARR